MTARRRKRIANRLGKKGLAFVRFEQGDRNLETTRAILIKRPEDLGRAFTYPRQFVLQAGPRVIADAILADYQRGYGHSSHR